jgi:hypothetical protein
MGGEVDMDVNTAWDDSEFQKNWEDTLKEYKVGFFSKVEHVMAAKTTQKYHSIHKSGLKLEDALTEEELKELRK